MRFLSIYRTAERNTPPSVEHIASMEQLIEEGMRAGWLVATEGCLPTALGARVRRADGNVTVTDGPFSESKEVIGGFALLETKSKQEAIDLTKRFLSVAGDGECEIRQIFTAPDNVGCDATETQAYLAHQHARR